MGFILVNTEIPKWFIIQQILHLTGAKSKMRVTYEIEYLGIHMVCQH